MIRPSNVKWIYCPSSIQLENQYPKDEKTELSVTGNYIHDLASRYIKGEINKFSYEHLNADYEGFKIRLTGEHIDHIIDYKNTIDHIVKSYESEYRVDLLIEEKLDIGKYNGDIDNWRGICDCLIKVYKDDFLVECVVIDFKTGFIKVDPSHPQMYSYMIGAVFSEENISPFAKFTTCVYQKGNFDLITIDLKKLTSIRNTLIKSAKLANDILNTHLSNGEHCKYCKHSDNCTTGGYKKYLQDDLKINLMIHSLSNIEDKNTQDLEELYLGLNKLSDVKKSISDKIIDKVLNNKDELKNLTLCVKKTREWVNLDEFIDLHNEDEIYEKKVKPFKDLDKINIDYNSFINNKKTFYLKKK